MDAWILLALKKPIEKIAHHIVWETLGSSVRPSPKLSQILAPQFNNGGCRW
jgi:hypothetical protein